MNSPNRIRCPGPVVPLIKQNSILRAGAGYSRHFSASAGAGAGVKIERQKHFLTYVWQLFICIVLGARAGNEQVTRAGAGQERTGSGARAVGDSARNNVRF